MHITLTAPPPRTSRILRMNQVIDKVGLSKATIYRLARLGLFPNSFRIGLAAVGFDEAEIELWILERKIGATLH
jgi:prophage regulatory protein